MTPAAGPRMTGVERRQQLMGVGRALFAARGFEATTMEEIAERAGVSKPLVYRHFGTKEALYQAIADEDVARQKLRPRRGVRGVGEHAEHQPGVAELGDDAGRAERQEGE